MWRNLIGDTCHSLIGGVLRLFLQDTWHGLIDQNVFIFKMIHVSNRLDHLCHCLHTLMCGLCHSLHVSVCDWFLHDTWQISVGFWVVIAKSSSNMWYFVIGCILWTYYDVSTCNRSGIFPFYKCPLETRSRTQFWSVVWEWVSKTDFLHLTL